MGTFLIIIGILWLASPEASKEDSNPLTRIKGQSICNIGCAIVGIIYLSQSVYSGAVIQLFVILANLYGIKNNRKVLKNKKIVNLINQSKNSFNLPYL